MRLDVFLVEKGFTTSRARAQEIISRGFVSVNGDQISKASKNIADTDYVKLENDLPYVSRAGEKLDFALEHFVVEVAGRHVLDIGSSTGGFSDAVLQKGAASVTAVDVGTNQFDGELAKNSRVTLFEQTDIRDFYPDKKFDVIVLDISFISQKEIIPHLKRFTKNSTDVIALIKPQFEVGKENVGRGGIVKNPDAVLDVLESIKEEYHKAGFRCDMDSVPSPLKGGGGNQEYLLHCSI